MSPKILVGVLALLTGCSSVQYGEFDGRRVKHADPDVYDVIIIASDGKLFVDGRKHMQLKPGLRLLQLASSKPGRQGEVTYRPFPLKVEPCTKYYFVAKHGERFTNTDWELVRVGESPLPKCGDRQ